MESSPARRIALYSATEHTRVQLESVLRHGGSTAGLEWFSQADDARDALTLRVRTQSLPHLFFIDLRHQPLEGAQLLRWLANAPALSRILLIVVVTHLVSESYLDLIGADVVTDRIPDAAKLRQLSSIGEQLSRLPPLSDTDSLPPTRRLPPSPPRRSLS